MYSKARGYVIGFHGCDESIKNRLINGKEFLKKEDKDYHWLGHGLYFWENSYERAIEYPQEIKKNPHAGHQKVKNPSVVGVVLSLGNCLDLLDHKFIQLLSEGFESLKEISKKNGVPLKENTIKDEGGFQRKRELDCAVINTIHEIFRISKKKPFDSVRGVFFEGDKVYPHASFYNKTHIQICVINPNCIKGFFNPLTETTNYPLP
jgi:hypothetical protein